MNTASVNLQYFAATLQKTSIMTELLRTNYFRFLFLLGCSFYFPFAFAQDKKTDTVKTSYFKTSGSYLTNSVYNGRKDSLLTPYITPSFGYYDKSGFYVTGSLSYLSNAAESRIDLYTFDIGYDFNFTDNFNAGVYANKSFYNQASTAIKSDVKGSIGTSLSYDFNFLQLNAGTDIMFANKADIALNIGLAHAFYIGDEGNLFSITPSVIANMSTLHFYEGYTNRKLGKNAKKAIPNLLSTASTTTVSNNKFTLMDYELSIPVTYDAKTFGIFFTPTFALPQNPIYTTTTTIYKLRNGTEYSQTQNSTPQSEKNLENTFYAELGIYFKF